MDFDALRARTLGSGADEEAVTVNTRALIDKVLARYSGEWTVLRELLQNAADALASRVSIKFETLPSATYPVPSETSTSSTLEHILKHHTLKRMIVSNNGHPFTENDWSRLKRIAEGNPDETKIGAFGVGFYSTFADCEEPFVSSGNEAMAFYWKSNSLFTRKLQLPANETNSETNFVLNYRDTTSGVPSLLPLAQFLASSLTFVGIEQIELWLDEWKVLRLCKKTSPSQDVAIPSDVETKTNEGLMKINKIVREMSQIDGQWMQIVTWRKPAPAGSRFNERENAPSLRKFFSRLAGVPTPDEARPTQHALASPEDLGQIVNSSIFLYVTTATLRTFPTSKFATELERATKKPPPRSTQLAVLTAPFLDKDLNSVAGASSVFANVLPTKSGRIFIGFPTHQTTGLSAHISAPSVIPTVERESIDLNARYVKSWNLELLRAAGIVCRIAWTTEMSDLREKIVKAVAGRKKIRIDDVNPFLSHGIAIAQNYTFRDSTPASQIGQVLEDAFWTCGKKASIDVLSSSGVLPTHEIRIAPKDLSFMEGIPIVPERMVSEAKAFVDKLTDFGLITEVTTTDMIKALEAIPLSSVQVAEFLNWLTKQCSQEKLDIGTIRNLLSVAVAHDDGEGAANGRLLLLGSIKHFLNASRIPADAPVPETVMPFKFTKSISKKDLENLGWQEFQMVPWARWLLEHAYDRNVLKETQNILVDASFSTHVLSILSKQWDTLSQSSKATLIEMMTARTIIPTKYGMKTPPESYFPSVKLFDDLPTVRGLSSVKDKFLYALGVRKTVELGVVFERLLSGKNDVNASDDPARRKWSHVDLISYLVSVKDDIPGADIQRLKNTPICPREIQSDVEDDVQKRYKVSELFEPRPVFRELGLPVLSWPGLYRGGAPEGKFLALLGLRNAPSVPELIDIMAQAGAKGDVSLRDKAMTYFLSNHHANGYAAYDYSKVSKPFLPLDNDSKRLSIPSRCFCDEGVALLGFDILRRELQSHATRFGVRTHPPIEQCIDVMASKPPSTQREARMLFAYFAGRLNEISGPIVNRLAGLNFVPVTSKTPEKQKRPEYVSPNGCFLGDSETFGDIFNYVDFGQEANAFLLKCGSKPEPTKVEIAQLLVQEPARILSTFGSADKYLSLLRSLADSIQTLKKNKQLFQDMRKAPFLLGSKELEITHNAVAKQASTSRQTDDIDDIEEEDLQGIREWQLTSAANAIIIDDYTSYRLFKADILAAPQEETLEDIYLALGAPLLSSLVEEAARHGPRAEDQRPAQKLQKQIYERSQLFLHDQPADSIKHDTRWLEKNLQVQLVSSISLRRSLKDRNLSTVEKRSAVVTQINREYTLWITGDRPDFYQVSQALVHLLLHRPKLHSSLTLEMLLKTDLLDLRTRGFNVSRILRQKAAEARIAESRRQQELETEQKRIQEQEKAWKKAQGDMKTKSEKHQLPGGFPDSPDRHSLPNGAPATPLRGVDSEVQQQPKNILSSLSRQLGLGERSRQLQSMLGNSSSGSRGGSAENERDPPPPYSHGGTTQQHGMDQQPVTAPHQLRENLLAAVRKARAHNSSDIFSRGETNVVNETTSYCDEHPAHDLAFVAELKNGIQMFLSPSSVQNGSTFLSDHSAGLGTFATLLCEVSTVFSLNPRVVNVFFDPNGKTIAFNRNGSVFCNYLYYQQLHETSVQQGEGFGDALVYWWIIFCHELAHNLVADHSSNHSYYTEGFVAQYFGKVVGLLSARVDTARI